MKFSFNRGNWGPERLNDLTKAFRPIFVRALELPVFHLVLTAQSPKSNMRSVSVY